MGYNLPKGIARYALFYGWYLVAISWTMAFLRGAIGVGIFFKPMLDEFGWTRDTLSMASSIAMLVFAGLYPFMGKLIDLLGARKVVFLSVSTQILSSVTNGLAANFWQVCTGRFLLEIKPTHAVQVLINRWFVNKRGLALGIISSGIPLGTLVLTPLSQYMITQWGWRPTLLFWAGVMAVVLLPLTFLISNKPEDKGLAPDGIPASNKHSRQQSIQSSYRQSREATIAGKKETGRNMAEALRSGSFWLLSVTQLVCGIGCGLLATHMVIFATDLGYSSMIAASFLSVMGGVSILGVLAAGQLSDRLARKNVLSLTHFIRCASFVTLAVTSLIGGSNLWLLYAATVLFGLGWFTTSPLAAALVADLFGYLRMGTILGAVLACHTVGTAIGTYAGGITFQLSGSYLNIFIIAGSLEFLAACFAFIIKKKQQVEVSTG